MRPRRCPVHTLVVAAAAAVGAIFGPAAAPGPVRADPPAETIRALADRYKAAVVTVSVIVRTTGGGGGGNNDMDMEIPGFVIDPSGLVVTTNAAIDPVSTFAAMDEDMMGKMTTRVVSAKILTPGGDEIPARVVLRDSDRNVAFLRPLARPRAPMAYVDLKAAGNARIGDPFYVLSRLGQLGNRSTQVQAMRVTSVVARPRTFYVADNMGMGMIGNPAFTESGAALGLITMRVGPSSRRRSLFSGNDSFLPVVLPAEDVLELARQAPQVKDVKEGDAAAPAPKKPGTARPTPVKPAAKKPAAKKPAAGGNGPTR